MTRRIRQQPRRSGFVLLATAIVLGAVLSAMLPGSRALATSGDSPYTVPFVIDTNPDPNVVETTLDRRGRDGRHRQRRHRARADVQRGDPRADVLLKVGDTVIVHYENHLSKPSAIHWHGIELENSMDGTPFTQNQVPAGGSFLYKFKVTRPGIYWYHPHHHASTNQVFKGLYGMIIVTDPNEAALQAAGRFHRLPTRSRSSSATRRSARRPGRNDAATYDPSLPWVGGGSAAGAGRPDPGGPCARRRADRRGRQPARRVRRGRHPEHPDPRHERTDERGADRSHERRQRRRASGLAGRARSARPRRVDARRPSRPGAPARDAELGRGQVHAPASHRQQRHPDPARAGRRRGRAARQRGRSGRHDRRVRHRLRARRDPAPAREAAPTSSPRFPPPPPAC